MIILDISYKIHNFIKEEKLIAKKLISNRADFYRFDSRLGPRFFFLDI